MKKIFHKYNSFLLCRDCTFETPLPGNTVTTNSKICVNVNSLLSSVTENVLVDAIAPIKFTSFNDLYL